MQPLYIILSVSIIICIILSAFFSSSETAFSSLNKIRMKNNADKDKRAKRALDITNSFDKMLSTILIGNNIVNITSATLGTVLFTSIFGDKLGPGLSTVVITIIVLIFGEVLPKSYAKEHSDQLSLVFSAPIKIIMNIFTPLSAFLVVLKRIFSFPGKKNKKESAPSVTEQELKVIVSEIENEGVLEEQESELVKSALDFDDITVDRILTPRVDLVAVDINDSIDDIRNMFLSERFSRVPVYKDTIDNIIGILYIKDFFKAYVTTAPEKIDIKNIMQPAVHVLPQKKISELMQELQSSKSHIVMVTDQYGGTLGIVTLEDILEELVGEIWDEDDDVVEDVIPLGNESFIINPDMDIHDLFEELGMSDDDMAPGINSVGGWVLDTLQKIPVKHDTFVYKNLNVSVAEVEDNRILKLIIKKRAQENEKTDKGEQK